MKWRMIEECELDGGKWRMSGNEAEK